MKATGWLVALGLGVVVCAVVLLSRSRKLVESPPAPADDARPAVSEPSVFSNSQENQSSVIDTRKAETDLVGNAPDEPSPPVQTLPLGPLIVEVVHKSDGRPAAGALVRIVSEDYVSGEPLGEIVETANDNGLVVANPLLGSLRVVASTASHEFKQVVVQHQTAGAPSSVRIELDALVGIVGEVHEPDGTAAPGVRVSSVASEAIGAPAVTTGPDGTFEFHEWMPDTVSMLSFESGEYGSVSVTLEAHADGSWRELGVSEDTASEWHPPGFPLSVSVARSRSIRGRVIEASGSPVGAAQVRASGVAQSSFLLSKRDTATSVTDSEGLFELGGLRSDIHHYVMCDAPAKGMAIAFCASGESVVDVGDVRLIPPCSVAGRIFDRQGAPIGGALLELHLPDASVLVRRESAGELPQAEMRITSSGVASSDGEFEVHGPMSKGLALSARLGRRELWRRPVDLEHGSVDLGTILSDLETQFLSGRLADKDDNALAGARLDILDDGGELWAGVTTAADGTFYFSMLDDALLNATVVVRTPVGRPVARWQCAIQSFPVELVVERLLVAP